MFFASDNSGPVPPQILAALSAANEGYTMGYGDEPQMKDVRRQLRDVFDMVDVDKGGTLDKDEVSQLDSQ